MGPGWEVLLLRCSAHCILTSPWPTQFLCGEKWHKPCLATSSTPPSHRLDLSGPFNLQLSCQNVMMNFLGLGFLEMYFLWGTLSISCNIIRGVNVSLTTLAGAMRAQYRELGEEVQMWRRRGIHRSQLRGGSRLAVTVRGRDWCLISFDGLLIHLRLLVRLQREEGWRGGC